MSDEVFEVKVGDKVRNQEGEHFLSPGWWRVEEVTGSNFRLEEHPESIWYPATAHFDHMPAIPDVQETKFKVGDLVMFTGVPVEPGTCFGEDHNGLGPHEITDIDGEEDIQFGNWCGGNGWDGFHWGADRFELFVPSVAPLPTKSILTQAQEACEGARQEDYGTPSVNHGRTAKLFSAYLGVEVDANMVCDLNILQKISRGMNDVTKDTCVDIAGYAWNKWEVNR